MIVPKNVRKVRAKEFYKEYALPRETEVKSIRMNKIRTLGLIGGIPPLVLLTFGSAVAWSLSGFKSGR